MAKEVHRMYHDRAMRPRDLLTYHVEYIIRSKGAKHLTSATLPRYSQMSLDVIAVISAVLFSVIALISYIVKKLCCTRKIHPQAKKNDRKQKKQ